MRFSGQPKGLAQFFHLEWFVIRGLILLVSSGEEICAGPGAAQVEVPETFSCPLLGLAEPAPAGCYLFAAVPHTGAGRGDDRGIGGAVCRPQRWSACLVPALRALRIDPMQMPRTK